MHRYAWVYMGIQGYTRVDKGMQGYTRVYIEITPWKMRAYYFYSGVEEYQKTHSFATLTRSFSDTPQRVNKIVQKKL